MKPRERVLLALNHQEPDRIPIDLGGTICSSIHKNAYIELKKHLGMEVEEFRMADCVQQLPYLDEALLERFGSARPRRWPTRSSGALTTWPLAAASSSPPSTTSRRWCLRRTSSPPSRQPSNTGGISESARR